MGDATVIVQLSDLHLGPPGATPYGADTEANLRRVIGVVRAMDLAPAAVLLTGDLSDVGDAASYTVLREIVDAELAAIGAPVLTVIGNHDHRGTFRQVFLGEEAADDDLPYHHTTDLDGVRIVMCDSYLAGEVAGALGDAQLAWLDEQLAGAAGRACIVALHHPAVPRGVPRPQDYLLTDREAFGEVLARHEVAAVLCGHSHVTTLSRFAGTLHAAAPATAYLLDPSLRSGARGYAGSGFAICTVRDGMAIVNPYVLPPDGSELYTSGPAARPRVVPSEA
jgi:3',5'-cyclic AMP phosphodiesterase CpdA